jgi:hypothetical protein
MVVMEQEVKAQETTEGEEVEDLAPDWEVVASLVLAVITEREVKAQETMG